MKLDIELGKATLTQNLALLGQEELREMAAAKGDPVKQTEIEAKYKGKRIDLQQENQDEEAGHRLRHVHEQQELRSSKRTADLDVKLFVAESS